MKSKLIIIFAAFILFNPAAFGKTPQEAVAFFKKYSEYANTYDEELLKMYSPDVKIIREVIKPSGGTEQVIIPSQRFFKELKFGQKTAKLRRYKNQYRNITVQELPNGIKISAERQPSKETYWLKMYQILDNTKDGFIIKEEMMQTKVQTFLRHKNKEK